MSELFFSEAQPKDIPQLASVLNDASDYKLRLGDSVWGTDGWTAEEIEDCMKESTMYLVKNGQEVVGTVSLQWDDPRNWGEQPPTAGYLHRLAVIEGHHGQGIGEQIVRWASERTAEKQRNFLRLDCEAKNTELCDYYKKLGFTQVGTRQVPEYGDYVAALFELPVSH